MFNNRSVCIGFCRLRCITGNNDVCDAVISSQVIRNRSARRVAVRTRIYCGKKKTSDIVCACVRAFLCT